MGGDSIPDAGFFRTERQARHGSPHPHDANEPHPRRSPRPIRPGLRRARGRLRPRARLWPGRAGARPGARRADDPGAGVGVDPDRGPLRADGRRDRRGAVVMDGEKRGQRARPPRGRVGERKLRRPFLLGDLLGRRPAQAFERLDLIRRGAARAGVGLASHNLGRLQGRPRGEPRPRRGRGSRAGRAPIRVVLVPRPGGFAGGVRHGPARLQVDPLRLAIRPARGRPGGFGEVVLVRLRLGPLVRDSRGGLREPCPRQRPHRQIREVPPGILRGRFRRARVRVGRLRPHIEGIRRAYRLRVRNRRRRRDPDGLGLGASLRLLGTSILLVAGLARREELERFRDGRDRRARFRPSRQIRPLPSLCRHRPALQRLSRRLRDAGTREGQAGLRRVFRRRQLARFL